MDKSPVLPDGAFFAPACKARMKVEARACPAVNAPTPTSPLPKSGEERPVYRPVALTRMVEPPR